MTHRRLRRSRYPGGRLDAQLSVFPFPHLCAMSYTPLHLVRQTHRPRLPTEDGPPTAGPAPNIPVPATRVFLAVLLVIVLALPLHSLSLTALELLFGTYRYRTLATEYPRLRPMLPAQSHLCPCAGLHTTYHFRPEQRWAHAVGNALGYCCAQRTAMFVEKSWTQ